MNDFAKKAKMEKGYLQEGKDSSLEWVGPEPDIKEVFKNFPNGHKLSETVQEQYSLAKVFKNFENPTGISRKTDDGKDLTIEEVFRDFPNGHKLSTKIEKTDDPAEVFKNFDNPTGISRKTDNGTNLTLKEVFKDFPNGHELSAEAARKYTVEEVFKNFDLSHYYKQASKYKITASSSGKEVPVERKKRREWKKPESGTSPNQKTPGNRRSETLSLS